MAVPKKKRSKLKCKYRRSLQKIIKEEKIFSSFPNFSNINILKAKKLNMKFSPLTFFIQSSVFEDFEDRLRYKRIYTWPKKKINKIKKKKKK